MKKSKKTFPIHLIKNHSILNLDSVDFELFLFLLTGSWCFYSSVGTPRTVPRPLLLILGHFTLSLDLSFKCWDTSRCPKTFRLSVGTLHAVPRSFVLVLGHFTLSQDLVLGHLALSQVLTLNYWDISHCPKTTHSSVGTLHTVPRPLTQVLGHFALYQDPSSKCWDTSYCPRTFCLSVGTLPTVPRPSVGTLRTVPGPPTQALGHFALSQDPSSK